MKFLMLIESAVQVLNQNIIALKSNIFCGFIISTTGSGKSKLFRENYDLNYDVIIH